MKLCGKPPALTSTQAYFCRLMVTGVGGRPSLIGVPELALKFGCSKTTISNAIGGRYTKHHEFQARAA